MVLNVGANSFECNLFVRNPIFCRCEFIRTQNPARIYRRFFKTIQQLYFREYGFRPYNYNIEVHIVRMNSAPTTEHKSFFINRLHSIHSHSGTL